MATKTMTIKCPSCGKHWVGTFTVGVTIRMCPLCGKES